MYFANVSFIHQWLTSNFRSLLLVVLENLLFCIIDSMFCDMLLNLLCILITLALWLIWLIFCMPAACNWIRSFLPTRRHASAVLALAMTFCLSVHLSVTSPCFINTVEQIEFIFSMEAFGGLFIPCVIRKFGYPIIKNNGTPSGTQTLDLENFATARRSLQCVVNLAR